VTLQEYSVSRYSVAQSWPRFRLKPLRLATVMKPRSIKNFIVRAAVSFEECRTCAASLAENEIQPLFLPLYLAAMWT